MHKQSASFFCHLLHRLFYGSDSGMHKCGECGASHTANTYIVGYAQSTFLHKVFCSYECCLCETKHCVKRNVLVNKFCHYLSPLLGTQCRRQYKVGIIGYMKFLQSVTISPQTLIPIAYARRTRDMNNLQAGRQHYGSSAACLWRVQPLQARTIQRMRASACSGFPG